MNSIDKPNKCETNECNNKAYAKNYLLPDLWEWVCRKHYYEYVYGINYQTERVRGKKNG